MPSDDVATTTVSAQIRQQSDMFWWLVSNCFETSANLSSTICSSKTSISRMVRTSANVRSSSVTGGNTIRPSGTMPLSRRNRCGDCDPRMIFMSGKDFVDHSAVDIRQSKIASGVAVCQLLMVDTQRVQDCRVQVVHVYFAFDGFVANFIR